MLQNIRDNATGLGAIFLLGLLILAFAIWGIDFQFGANQPVVTVNGEEVPNYEIANSYNQQIQRFQEFYPNGIPELTQAELKQNVIDSFVRNELMTQHVAEQGYRVADMKVMEAILAIPAFQLDGKFDKTQFDFVARRNGKSSDGLFNEFRQSQVLQQLTEGFVNSSFVTKDEARLRGELESEKRTVRELTVSAAKLLPDATVENSAVETDYEINQSEYVTEEMVSIDYIELDPKEVGKGIEINEEDVQVRYQIGLDTDEYSSPEQRNSRHILVAVNDSRSDAEALTQAQDLRARIVAGEDFAELAKEYSDDAGSKPSGGELGWNSGEGFVGPFKDALLSMTLDQISEPIKTNFGYHIIRVDGIRGIEPKPLEEVRARIEEELREGEALDRLSELVNKVDEVVYDIDDSLSSAAEAAAVEVQKVSWFTRASGSGIASFPEVRDIAFSQAVLNDRLNSTSIELDGKYVYLRVNDHRPARTMTLDEVRPRIEARLKLELASEQTAALGSDLLARLNQGESLEDVAGSAELELAESKEISRLDRSLPVQASNALFAATVADGKPTFGGLALPGGDFYIFELQSIEKGASLDGAKLQDVARANANMELAAYISSLREQAEVKVAPDQLRTQ